MDEKIKKYIIFKNVNPPAKIMGLFYNTFFLWVVLSAIFFMLGSALAKIIGAFIALIFIGITYLALFFLQTKYGPKKIAKIYNNFYFPINHIKIKKSPKKIY